MKYLKIIFILTFITSLSAGVLSVADLLSREKIEENRQEEINRSVKSIMYGAKEIVDKEDFYEAYSNDGVLLGYVFIAVGQGYQGKIEIICGIDPNFSKIKGIEILSSKETPGLGAKINTDWFKDQFKDLVASPKIDYTKKQPLDSNQIQAITGATISSRAVVNILNIYIDRLRDRLKSE